MTWPKILVCCAVVLALVYGVYMVAYGIIRYDNLQEAMTGCVMMPHGTFACPPQQEEQEDTSL